MKFSSTIIAVSTVASALCVAGFTGFQFAKSSQSISSNSSGALDARITALESQLKTLEAGGVEAKQPMSTPVVPASSQPAVNASESQQDSQAAQAQANVPSSEDLAKEKGIVSVIENDAGRYSLVSVIEGVAPNQQLSQNLNLVTLQRQQLAQLSRQFDQAPMNAVQQRELLAGKIHETRNMLNRNLQFMANNYGYTINNDYLQLPYNVDLMIEVKEGEKSELKLVHAFTTAEDYQTFQKENVNYLMLKQELARLESSEEKPAAKDSKNENASGGEEVAVVADSEDASIKSENGAEALSPALKIQSKIDELVTQFNTKYKYNPEVEHRLLMKRTALYVRQPQ